MFLCNCPRFCVSLVCGPQPERDDIAFQLTTHFDTSWVVRNSKLNKEWGAEEGAAARNFPFQRQQPFTIEIFTSPSSYVVSPNWSTGLLSVAAYLRRLILVIKTILIYIIHLIQVAVDGRHHCDYVHRVPFSEADTLQISGDVLVSLIEFKSTNTYPTFPSGQRLNVVNPVGLKKIKRFHCFVYVTKWESKTSYQPIPFASLINGPLGVGSEIQVHGQVRPHPNRLTIANVRMTQRL